MNRRGFIGMLVGAAVTPFLPKPVKPLFEPGEAMFFLPPELKMKVWQPGIATYYSNPCLYFRVVGSEEWHARHMRQLR